MHQIHLETRELFLIWLSLTNMAMLSVGDERREELNILGYKFQEYVESIETKEEDIP